MDENYAKLKVWKLYFDGNFKFKFVLIEICKREKKIDNKR